MTDKAEELQLEYSMRFSKTERYRNGVWKILCDEFFSRYIPPEACVLDLGCGWGEFINNIRAAEKHAIDLNPDAGQRVSSDTHFSRQNCSEEWQVRQESLDVIFTSNFFEHLPSKNDVTRALGEAYRCLKYGGLIICLGPNIKYLPGKYWDFWDHSVPITESSLSEVLNLNGFSVESGIPRFLPYSMSTGSTPPLFLVKWYLKLPILWPWFGKQFLVVARKGRQTRPLSTF